MADCSMLGDGLVEDLEGCNLVDGCGMVVDGMVKPEGYDLLVGWRMLAVEE